MEVKVRIENGQRMLLVLLGVLGKVLEYIPIIITGRRSWDLTIQGSVAIPYGTLYIYIYIYIRYAHYDGNPSFSDFKPFGGLSSPAIKQYKGTTSYCGASIEENYY